ncbi:MAG: NAD-dependent epimerase/dehydratase family protein [Acidobacteriota bacterium]
MKALVTGAGGFIGGAIARRLVERGDTVRSFSRSRYAALEPIGIEQVQGDLGEAGDVSNAVAGVDAVFHVAARFDLWGRYEDFFRTNTLGTRHILQACREHGVAKLVFTSTPSVVHGGDSVDGVDESAPYPDHFEAHYPATKALAEQEVLAANDESLSTVALRPHLVWGPGDSSALPRLAARARSGRLRMVGKPQKIDVSYIDNVVDAHVAAADRLSPEAACAGKAYFLSQGEPVRGPQFVNDLLGAAGLPPVQRTVPLWLARSLAAVVEGVWSALGRQSEPPLTRFMVSQLATAHWYDISAARRDLDFAPSVSYEEGMTRLRRWLEENPGFLEKHAP